MGKFGQKYNMVYCIEGFWKVKETPVTNSPFSKLYIGLSVSAINAM